MCQILSSLGETLQLKLATGGHIPQLCVEFWCYLSNIIVIGSTVAMHHHCIDLCARGILHNNVSITYAERSAILLELKYIA